MMRNAMGVAIPPAGALDCLPRAASQPEPLASIIPRALAALARQCQDGCGQLAAPNDSHHPDCRAEIEREFHDLEAAS